MPQLTTAQDAIARRYSVNGGEFTLQEMISANAEDEDFCKWLLDAKIGDEYTNGGGAAAVFVTRRTA